MTSEEQAPEVEEQPSRLAGGCVLVVAAAAAGGVVYAVPEVGYYAAGLLTTAGISRVRTWAAGRRTVAEEQPEDDAVDIVATLHELSPAGAANVRLTQLQEATGLPDTKAVRVLLDEEGVPVRAGVRADGKNGPGVHSDDIPRWPCGPSSEGCWCTSGANANANNAPGEGPGEGLRVEAIGQAGTVVHTPAEASRHHRVPATKTR